MSLSTSKALITGIWWHLAMKDGLHPPMALEMGHMRTVGTQGTLRNECTFAYSSVADHGATGLILSKTWGLKHWTM